MKSLTKRQLIVGGATLILAAPVIVRRASLMNLRGTKLILSPPKLRLEDIIAPRPRYYKLDEHHQPVLVSDVLEWARFFESDPNRIVAQTALPNGDFVSTVFIGVDHNFFPDGDHRPVVFETMIFRDKDESGPQYRYRSWDEAETHHQQLVREFYDARRREGA